MAALAAMIVVKAVAVLSLWIPLFRDAAAMMTRIATTGKMRPQRERKVGAQDFLRCFRT